MQLTKKWRASLLADRAGLARMLIGAAALSLFVVIGASSSTSAAPVRSSAKVYLLRGFANVFSLGMDELATKLQQRGIRADVSNHLAAAGLAAEAAADYKAGRTRSIILIGHSWGALAVVDMVKTLGEAGVPVALAVTLDTNSSEVNGTVTNFYNLYVNTGAFSAGKGFHGRLINIDLAKRGMDVGHFNIDKTGPVQAMILGYVAQAVGGGGHRAAAPASSEPKPRAAPGKPTQHASVRVAAY
jgi:hypothetical protein